MAIFLIDTSFFKIDQSLDVLKEANAHREDIFYYLLLLIAVEFVLRFVWAVISSLVAMKNRILKGRSDNGSDGAPEPLPEEGPPPEEEDQDVGSDDVPANPPEADQEAPFLRTTQSP